MTKYQKASLLFLRLSLGWLLFYAGITKVLADSWSAEFYLKEAKLFPEMYAFFLQPDILPYVNLLNMWGLTLVGAALILGVFVRFASLCGIALMILYYLPILDFPYPNAHSYIVDEHIVYAFALLVLAVFRAGRYFGLENRCVRCSFCNKFPRLRSLLG